MRRAFVVYDSDLAQKTRVQAAERGLAAALLARGVDALAVRLPPAPNGDKQGADDFLTRRGKAAFTKLVCKAKPFSNLEPQQSGGPITLLVQRGDEADMERTEFLWAPYIPTAKLSGVKGDPGGGKTTMLLGVAADLSRGRLPATDGACKPVNILYFSHENDPTSQVYPRFEAAGGDRTRLYVVTGAEGSDGKPRAFSLADTEA